MERGSRLLSPGMEAAESAGFSGEPCPCPLSPQGERDRLGAWHTCWEDSTIFAFELLGILKIPR